MNSAHPCVHEVNAQVFLYERQRDHGARRTLADLAEEEIDLLAPPGVDYLWLMGVWTTGPRSLAQARHDPGMRRRYDEVLPGWTYQDVVSSPFAIADYRVSPVLGGDDALAHLRRRLATRGVGLLLDFVPNHVGLDHSWVRERPDLIVKPPHGRRDLGFMANHRWLAHGRDPYFPPWVDTAQVDYRSAAARAAMEETLGQILDRCDGVRCDMAMLLLEDVFRETWRDAPPPPDPARGEFWPPVIARARDRARQGGRSVLFLAEAYWGREFDLQQQGFDYTYDKTLYDRLVHRDHAAVKAHLCADRDFLVRSARFVENHDEPRAASIWHGQETIAATVAAMALPGLRLWFQGQERGLRAHAPVQIRRWPEEPARDDVGLFWRRLLPILPHLRGDWTLLDARPPLLAWVWDRGREGRWLCVVNLSDLARPFDAPVAIPGLIERTVTLSDLLGDRVTTVPGSDLRSGRTDLLLRPWQASIFALA